MEKEKYLREKGKEYLRERVRENRRFSLLFHKPQVMNNDFLMGIARKLFDLF